ncbi:MAG: metalloregulator ArsR/SmtB family transcription factor [archaeon]|nr:metalloregulator ArsR/SmtB family transcription factor [archaeon]
MKTYILNALADDTRLKLLKKISNGEICACELPAFVKKSQPAVSQHLKELRGADLVSVRRNGSRRLYSLTPKAVRILKDISRW